MLKLHVVHKYGCQYWQQQLSPHRLFILAAAAKCVSWPTQSRKNTHFNMMEGDQPEMLDWDQLVLPNWKTHRYRDSRKNLEDFTLEHWFILCVCVCVSDSFLLSLINFETNYVFIYMFKRTSLKIEMLWRHDATLEKQTLCRLKYGQLLALAWHFIQT